MSALTSNELQVTIKDDTGNQALDYVNLTLQGTAGTINAAASAGALNYSTYASTSTSTTLQLRNLGLTPGSSRTIAFFVTPATTGCTDGSWFNLVAQSAANGNFFTFPAPTITGGLTTLVAQGCTLDFTVQPAAALKGAVISNQPYTTVANGGTAVTVEHTHLPVPLNGGTVTLGLNGQFDPASGNVPALQNNALPFSNGTVAFPGLDSTGTGGPLTLSANAPGFTLDSATSSPFVVTQDGETCNGQCSSLLSKTNGNPLVSIATSGGFAFVGASPSDVLTDAQGQLPAGCQSWTPTLGINGFVEFDGGRDLNSTMTITYYVSQSALKAKYGKNVGNQFTPICFGAKPIVNGVVVDCTALNAPDPWWGEEVTGTPANFTGNPKQSKCGPGGYDWGILGSYQQNIQTTHPGGPFVASWNGSTQIGGNFRSFNIFEPSGWDGRGTS